MVTSGSIETPYSNSPLYEINHLEAMGKRLKGDSIQGCGSGTGCGTVHTMHILIMHHSITTMYMYYKNKLYMI